MVIGLPGLHLLVDVPRGGDDHGETFLRQSKYSLDETSQETCICCVFLCIQCKIYDGKEGRPRQRWPEECLKNIFWLWWQP